MATLISSIETQARRHLLEPAALSTPSAPTVTPVGTAGSTTRTYKVVALNANGTTDASAVGSTTTSNATLSATNFNRITWTAVTNATGYWVFRTVSVSGPATTGLIARVGAVTTLDDIGLAGDSSTAPIINTTGLADPFWSSAELVDIINKGINDMWGAIIDLHQEHFLTIDTTNVSLVAGATTLSGVPSDCFRVHLIEPTDTTATGSYRNLIFRPKDYNSNDFILARSLDNQDPTQALIMYYCLTNAGAPVSAPSVQVAPKLSATLSTLRFAYIPTPTPSVSSDNNPIPGNSDQALIAWCVAWARAKETEDRMPDANWLAAYATEKQAILTRSTPRQEQEPDVVEDFFDNRW